MGRNIGLIGRARSGKDTAGRWLVEHGGYERVAFADPLKVAAWRIDPWICLNDWPQFARRLSDKVAGPASWERAKDDYPEVRRILQELGAAVRALDEDFWLRLALEKTTDVNAAGAPVVITDVRYPNEAESLRRAGFTLVYISRPGVPHLDHESEGALTMADADYVVANNADLDTFKHRVKCLWHQLNSTDEEFYS